MQLGSKPAPTGRSGWLRELTLLDLRECDCLRFRFQLATGASIPFVPNRETGEMEEAHYIKESLGRSTVRRLCRELMKPDSKLERLIIEDCNLGVATGEALGLALPTQRTSAGLKSRGRALFWANADWGDLSNVRSSPTITVLGSKQISPVPTRGWHSATFFRQNLFSLAWRYGRATLTSQRWSCSG